MSDVKLFRLCGSAPVIDMRTGHNATLRPGLVVMSEDAHTHAIAALSAQQSAQQSASPEFCCELSYKAAKQKAWDARLIERCKCDHNEYCDHCWPADFRPGGKWHGKFVAQQSAHVSMPRELLADLVSQDHDTRVQAERRLYALLNGGEA